MSGLPSSKSAIFTPFSARNRANGRGRSRGQTAGGGSKAFPRLKQPLFAVPALRELESACRVSLCEMLSQYPQSAFQGFSEGRRKRSAAVGDPKPPRPFARSRSAFFALFRRARTAPGKSRKRRKKGLFPQMSSDLLKPPSLKPPFAALQEKEAGPQKTRPGPPLPPRILQKLWDSSGGFCCGNPCVFFPTTLSVK